MRRCTYCMRETDDGNICRYCGGDENKPSNPRHLPPNTAIGDRYIVGRALNQTEDAIIYAALDQRTQERIRIYEYYPRRLARRDARTLEVAPVPGSEQAYADGLEALHARMEELGCRLYEGNGSIYAAVDKQQAAALRAGAAGATAAAHASASDEGDYAPEDADELTADELTEEELEDEQEYEDAAQKRRSRIMMGAIGAGCVLFLALGIWMLTRDSVDQRSDMLPTLLPQASAMVSASPAPSASAQATESLPTPDPSTGFRPLATDNPSWIEDDSVINSNDDYERPTRRPTRRPTEVPTLIPTPAPTPIPTDVPQITEVPTEIPQVTANPTEIPTPIPTDLPEATANPTDMPTVIPTAEPEITPEPTVIPTDEPEITPEPTVIPTDEPEITPEPTVIPTDEPEITPEPTVIPTAEPEITPEPTVIPTDEPEITPEPTEVPTEEPTEEPTEVPTEEPTEEPTEVPTEEPTEEPTEVPTEIPTEEPTEVPTEEPTPEPTMEPSQFTAYDYMPQGRMKFVLNDGREMWTMNMDDGATVMMRIYSPDGSESTWYYSATGDGLYRYRGYNDGSSGELVVRSNPAIGDEAMGGRSHVVEILEEGVLLDSGELVLTGIGVLPSETSISEEPSQLTDEELARLQGIEVPGEGGEGEPADEEGEPEDGGESSEG